MNHKICRACLQPSNDSIFKQVNVDGKEILLVDMLKLCTGLEVTKFDQISLDICNNCIKFITQMYLYRQTCWNSQAFLLSEFQKLNTENLMIIPNIMNCDINQKKEIQSNVINPIDIVETSLDHAEQRNDNKELQPSESDTSKTTYTRKQTLSLYCEFIKKSPKRGSNGAWKCRKCGNIYITTLGILRHLDRAHSIKIKYPEAKRVHKMSTSICIDLTEVITKQQALSTFTFYPYLDQANSSLPRTTQECRECGYTNIVPNQMIYHLRNSHNIRILDDGEFQCSLCDVKCRSYYFLLLHEKTHNESTELPLINGISRRNYECSKCDQKFETRFNLNRHMKIHVRKPNVIIPKRKAWVKKCICEHCGETFATPHSLREHVRTHTGEKPYNCKLCDYRASHYSSIMLHMRLHEGIRPYKCEICDKRFLNSSGLANHRIVHSNEMPYKCMICSKKYKYESVFRMHLKSHDPDTFVACEFCGRKFAAKATLNLHRKQHTGEKPHACEICDKRFIQRKSWRLHMKNHHQKIVK